MVRAKFKVDSYETRLDRQEELRTIKLNVVYGDSEENKKFFKYTPSGRIEIGTLNKTAWEQLPLGAEVYVELRGVEEPTPTADEYFISFYTKDCPKGTMDAVRVRLDMFRQNNMDAKMNIALCDHPLYHELVRYVQANPIPSEVKA